LSAQTFLRKKCSGEKFCGVASCSACSARTLDTADSKSPNATGFRMNRVSLDADQFHHTNFFTKVDATKEQASSSG
jgi:hypothetical protein